MASSSAPQTSAPKQDIKKTQLDFIKRDGTLKEQVVLENKTSENYDRKWGFLKDFDKLCIEEAQSTYKLTEKQFKDMIERKRIREKKEFSRDLEIPFKPVPSWPVPKLSSATIGWRSARPECSLEIMGPLYISNRFTIEPPEKRSDPPQTCIFLG